MVGTAILDGGKVSIKAIEDERREVKKSVMVGIGNGYLEMMKGTCF